MCSRNPSSVCCGAILTILAELEDYLVVKGVDVSSGDVGVEVSCTVHTVVVVHAPEVE